MLDAQPYARLLALRRSQSKRKTRRLTEENLHPRACGTDSLGLAEPYSGSLCLGIFACSDFGKPA